MLILIIKESGSSGDEAANTFIAEHREDIEYFHQIAEISTQTDRKTETDISTQTGYNDDEDTTVNTYGLAEEVFTMETVSCGEDSLSDSVVVIAEEVVEDTATSDNRTAGIIPEEVVIMGNYVYENMVFRAERVEVTDIFEMNHIKDYNPEENNTEESVPLEVSVRLPKVLADCVEAVFAAVSTSTDFAAVNTSEPSVDEVITEDNGEGAGDMSADVVLIETAEPEFNAVPTEARETNGVPSLGEELVTTVMETISEVVCEEPNPTPAKQEIPVEEIPVPLEIDVVFKVESAHEDATADDTVAVEDVPGISEQENLITFEELPEDTLNSPDDEVKPESTPELITTNENAEVGEDVRADLGPEKVEKRAKRGPVVVKDDAEVIPEAAIDALSQELELRAITPQEPAVGSGIPLEEVIDATTFVPLSGQREASPTVPEEPSETIVEEMNEEEAIEALLNEIEALPQSVEEDTTGQEEALENMLESVVEAISERLEATENIAEEPADEPRMDATEESELCVSVQEELVDVNVRPAEVLLDAADKETDAPSVVTVEEPADSNSVNSEEPVEENAILPEQEAKTEVLVVILETTDHSGDVLSAIEENSEDSQIATSDEPVAEDIEAVLEAIVEEIITEDVAAECNLSISEELASEIIAEGETEEKTENNSSVKSTDLTLGSQSVEIIEDTPVTSTEIDSLLVRLESACSSVVEESVCRLGGLKTYTLRYNITVNIHMIPKEQQQ